MFFGKANLVESGESPGERQMRSVALKASLFYKCVLLNLLFHDLQYCHYDSV